MVTPIRIGDLTIHLSQLCYAREQGDRLHLFMSCGLLTLEGVQAQTIRAYLRKHSEELPTEPELPRWKSPRAQGQPIIRKGA